MKNFIHLLVLILILNCSCDDQNKNPISIEYSISPITSISKNDGKIDISVVGGKMPYTYLWSDGSTNEDLTNVSIGEYTIEITDADGQTIEETIAVTDKFILYKIPESIDDGWNIANLEELPVNYELIFEGLKELNSDNNKIHSILISLNGEMILEKYYPGYDSKGNLINFDMNTLHEVQSTSKSCRSALIGIAIEKAYIPDEKTLLKDLLPDFSEFFIDGKENITLEHVLTMSSGLEWNEWYGTPNYLSQMYTYPYQNWTSFVISKPLENEPGTVWEYHSGASIMLNDIINRSLDTDFSLFVHTNFTSKIESSNPQGFGSPLGPKTLPRDMLKFGYVYLNDGKWKENQIISKEWITKSFERRFYVPEGDAYYGYQWWIKDLSVNNNSYECFYTSGNGGQFIMVLKDLDLVIVFTGGDFNNFSTLQYPFQFVIEYIIPAIE